VTRAAEILDAAVPEPVRTVCRRLTEAGFEACAVGGAVRDALLDRDIGDWDVATSARPEEVVGLFRRTVPTGLKHGTVTVLIGRGAERQAIEVTTYRGEGAYSDARHPDSVTFGVTLEEDLARRDFVINAMAYDPVTGALHDPFRGAEDLGRRVIRAVGDARQRFTEDGLRVMRAARFAAVLEFDLEAATEAAIRDALPSLERVSRERVRDELFKMLVARQPSRGLRVAARTGILESVLPEVAPDDAMIARVEAATDFGVRLTALLAELSPQEAERVGRRLRLSNAERELVVQLVEFFPPPSPDPGDADVRRLVGLVGRERTRVLVALWRAAGVGAELGTRVLAVVESDAALTVGELCLSGADVIRALDVEAGPVIGRVLRELLERVLDDPALNRRDRLEALIPDVHASLA